MFLFKWLAPWWGQNSLSGILSIFTADRGAGGPRGEEQALSFPTPCPRCLVALSRVVGSARCRPEEGASQEAECPSAGCPVTPALLTPSEKCGGYKGAPNWKARRARRRGACPVSPLLSSLGSRGALPLGLASSSPTREWGGAGPPGLGCKWVEKLNSHGGTRVGHTTDTRPRTSNYTHLLMRIRGGRGRGWAPASRQAKAHKRNFSGKERVMEPSEACLGI